jgi:hypothetical protein
VLAYRSPHLYPTRCVGLSTYVILSFLNLFSFLFTLPPIVFVFFTSPFIFSHSSPLLVGHSSLFLPLNSSRLASASFPSLPVCSLCCLCCSVVVRVSWTEGDSVRVGKPHTSLSTIPGHRQQARCGALPPAKASKAREPCSSAPLPPPCPRCGRNHKPNGRSPRVVVDSKESTTYGVLVVLPARLSPTSYLIACRLPPISTGKMVM